MNDLRLPDGWRLWPFDECVSDRGAARLPSVPQTAYLDEGRFPVIDQGVSPIAGYTDDDEIVHRDDLPLIVFGDHTRTLKYADAPFATGADGTKLIKANTGVVDPRFFFYALRNLDLPSRGYNRHFSKLREQNLAVPANLSEQERIASALGKLELRCRLESIRLETVRTLKAATMAKVFREGLRGEPRQVASLGTIPTSWKFEPVRRLVAFPSGLVDPRVEPFASMMHVGPDSIESGTSRMLPCSTAREVGLISGKYLFEPGDVLFSKIRPNLKKVTRARVHGLCSADMYPLRSRGSDPDFLSAALLSDVCTSQIVAQQARTGIPKVNREQLGGVLVPVPENLDDQREIGRVFARLSAAYEAATIRAECLGALFASTLASLMTGGFDCRRISMPDIPTERSAVQEPILRYASEIGWSRLTREQALTLRGGESGTLLYPILREKLIELNSGVVTPENVDAIVARIESARPSIEGSAEVLAWLRGERTVFVEAENRQRNVTLIDFDRPAHNLFQVTDEWEYTNGQYTNRADVLFLINGVPVALVEAKSPRKRDGIHEGLTQIRRYHRETPELMVAPQVFDVTHLVHFFYGATWSLERKTLFNWKDAEPGNFERKVKRFFARERFLRMLRDWIVVVRKDDELTKVVLRQHQTRAVERSVERCLDPERRRGLVWHTQGSGKTFTMIAAAEQVLGNTAFAKPTVLLLVDRNELETQLFGNLKSYGLPFEPATSKLRLRELLRSDYRGLIVAMIHKFEAADAGLCARDNVFVFVDEAHRSTGGTLGNYLLGALPNATFLGFTGTPIDRTAHGEGTFKTFGVDDPPKGYLDKYAIRESIGDETTLRLRYTLAPNEIRVPRATLESEFLDLAEAEGVSDFEELDRILVRAVKLKAFLKADDRIAKVAAFVAEHYRNNVEPLGYKAFLVGVDREACALYKKALDRHLPTEASRVVYTAAHNDSERLAAFHLSDDEEKKIRKAFTKPGHDPRILIVTEKLLTGFDAPILYCMYLDKPMRDHTLLQAIARVNRPYEDEAETRKPSGLVIDFVGIFERLEKALRFDSADIEGLLEDVDVLRERYAVLMSDPAPRYLALFAPARDDKAFEARMEAFADREAREIFFDFFRELRTLYEVLSPDAALRRYVDDYMRLSVLYDEVQTFYATTSIWDTELARKTERLVRDHAESAGFTTALPVVEIDENTLDALARSGGPPRSKVFNLARSLAQAAKAKAATQPYLIPIGERAEAIVEAFDDRQIETQQALAQLQTLVGEFAAAERERAETGFDLPTYTVYQVFTREGIANARELAPKLAVLLTLFPNRAHNARELRGVKAALYKELLPAVGKERMVNLAEQVLRLVRT